MQIEVGRGRDRVLRTLNAGRLESNIASPEQRARAVQALAAYMKCAAAGHNPKLAELIIDTFEQGKLTVERVHELYACIPGRGLVGDRLDFVQRITSHLELVGMADEQARATVSDYDLFIDRAYERAPARGLSLALSAPVGIMIALGASSLGVGVVAGAAIAVAVHRAGAAVARSTCLTFSPRVAPEFARRWL